MDADWSREWQFWQTPTQSNTYGGGCSKMARPPLVSFPDTFRSRMFALTPSSCMWPCKRPSPAPIAV